MQCPPSSSALAGAIRIRSWGAHLGSGNLRTPSLRRSTCFGCAQLRAPPEPSHTHKVCYDGTIRGWGYNRQKQALGDESDDTFVKPSCVEDMPEGFKGHSVAVGGAQSYAILKPPGQ